MTVLLELTEDQVESILRQLPQKRKAVCEVKVPRTQTEVYKVREVAVGLLKEKEVGFVFNKKALDIYFAVSGYSFSDTAVSNFLWDSARRGFIQKESKTRYSVNEMTKRIGDAQFYYSTNPQTTLPGGEQHG